MPTFMSIKIVSLVISVLLLAGCSISKISMNFYANPANWDTYTYPAVGCQLKHPPMYMDYDAGYWQLDMANPHVDGIARALKLQRMDDKIEIQLIRIHMENLTDIPARIKNDPEWLDYSSYRNWVIASRQTIKTHESLEGLKVTYNVYPIDAEFNDKDSFPTEVEMTKIFVYFVLEKEIFEMQVSGESVYVAELEPEIDAIMENFSVIPIISEDEADGN